MQTKLTIEVIVDYRDKSKLPAIITAGKRAAARLNAAVQLLTDGQPAQVVYYSDDFFTGRSEIEYLMEEIEQEEQKPAPAEPPLSDEFLDALKGDK